MSALRDIQVERLTRELKERYTGWAREAQRFYKLDTDLATLAWEAAKVRLLELGALSPLTDETVQQVIWAAYSHVKAEEGTHWRRIIRRCRKALHHA